MSSFYSLLFLLTLYNQQLSCWSLFGKKNNNNTQEISPTDQDIENFKKTKDDIQKTISTLIEELKDIKNNDLLSAKVANAHKMQIPDTTINKLEKDINQKREKLEKAHKEINSLATLPTKISKKDFDSRLQKIANIAADLKFGLIKADINSYKREATAQVQAIRNIIKENALVLFNINSKDIAGKNLDEQISEFKKRYKKLALKFHPDKGGAKEIFQLINEAYAILTTPEYKTTNKDFYVQNNPIIIEKAKEIEKTMQKKP